jgi:hypothetical protein
MRQLTLFAVVLFFFSSAQAEVISIADPRYDIPNSEAGVERPVQGMDMAAVEAKFGAPEQKNCCCW